jgi:hypothetical protein
MPEGGRARVAILVAVWLTLIVVVLADLVHGGRVFLWDAGLLVAVVLSVKWWRDCRSDR